jgi:periplasmic divalent cation tolerance protein
LAKVNSSAITARHPDVPNLICVAIARLVCFENLGCQPANAKSVKGLDAQSYMTDKRLVLTTCASLEEARCIAHTLVERQLAACVNIVPQIESFYRWKDEVETSTEWLLLIKTSAEIADRVRESLNELHSYEIPECIEIAIEAGNAAYLEWIGESVR